MKKFICNNKLKKLCTSFLVFLMLFNFVFPSFVLATAQGAKNAINGGVKVTKNSEKQYTYTGTIQNMVYSFNTKTYDQAPNPSMFDLIGNALSANDCDRYEQLVKAGIKEYIEKQGYSIETTDGNLEKIYHDMKNSNKISVTAIVKKSNTEWDVATYGEDAGVLDYLKGFADGRWVVSVNINSQITETDFKRSIGVSTEDIDRVDYRGI